MYKDCDTALKILAGPSNDEPGSGWVITLWVKDYSFSNIKIEKNK